MLLREAVFWSSQVREIGLLLIINTEHVKNFHPYVILKNSCPCIVKAQDTQGERESVEREWEREGGRRERGGESGGNKERAITLNTSIT